jgi:hypothetical protein
MRSHLLLIASVLALLFLLQESATAQTGSPKLATLTVQGTETLEVAPQIGGEQVATLSVNGVAQEELDETEVREGDVVTVLGVGGALLAAAHIVDQLQGGPLELQSADQALAVPGDYAETPLKDLTAETAAGTQLDPIFKTSTSAVVAGELAAEDVAGGDLQVLVRDDEGELLGELQAKTVFLANVVVDPPESLGQAPVDLGVNLVAPPDALVRVHGQLPSGLRFVEERPARFDIVAPASRFEQPIGRIQPTTPPAPGETRQYAIPIFAELVEEEDGAQTFGKLRNGFAQPGDSLEGRLTVGNPEEVKAYLGDDEIPLETYPGGAFQAELPREVSPGSSEFRLTDAGGELILGTALAIYLADPGAQASNEGVPVDWTQIEDTGDLYFAPGITQTKHPVHHELASEAPLTEGLISSALLQVGRALSNQREPEDRTIVTADGDTIVNNDPEWTQEDEDWIRRYRQRLREEEERRQAEGDSITLPDGTVVYDPEERFRDRPRSVVAPPPASERRRQLMNGPYGRYKDEIEGQTREGHDDIRENPNPGWPWRTYGSPEHTSVADPEGAPPCDYYAIYGDWVLVQEAPFYRDKRESSPQLVDILRFNNVNATGAGTLTLSGQVSSGWQVSPSVGASAGPISVGVSITPPSTSELDAKGTMELNISGVVEDSPIIVTLYKVDVRETRGDARMFARMKQIFCGDEPYGAVGWETQHREYWQRKEYEMFFVDIVQETRGPTRPDGSPGMLMVRTLAERKLVGTSEFQPTSYESAGAVDPDPDTEIRDLPWPSD